MSRALRIQILEYLKEHDAVDKKIDIALHFLESDDSKERRLVLSNALEYLKKANLIELQGRSLNMLSTSGDRMPSKYDSDLKASITIQGENHLKLANEAIEVITESRQNSPLKITTHKKMLVFISHSSKDKDIATLFIDKILKLTLKIDTENIFFTSLSETTIKSGNDFRKAIKNNLEQASMVIQIITTNYLASEVCLIEMGASWVLNNKLIPFIVSPINYDSVGFIHQPNQILKLESKQDVIKFIDEEKLETNKIKHNEIERHVEEFLSEVKNKIDKTPISKSKIEAQIVNDLGLVENDVVEIENRDGLYLYQNEKLIHIADDSRISLFVYGFDKTKMKILKPIDANNLIDKVNFIPALFTCKIVIVSNASHKKWLIVNNERRYLPNSVYTYLVKKDPKPEIIFLTYNELTEFTEGNKLNDIQGHFAY